MLINSLRVLLRTVIMIVLSLGFSAACYVVQRYFGGLAFLVLLIIIGALAVNGEIPIDWCKGRLPAMMALLVCGALFIWGWKMENDAVYAGCGALEAALFAVTTMRAAKPVH